MTNKPSAPREFQCQYDPDTNELKYAHNHGCSDGWEDVHLVEHSAYLAALEKCKKLKADLKIYEGPRLTSAGQAIKHYQLENQVLRNQVAMARGCLKSIIECRQDGYHADSDNHFRTIAIEALKTLEAKDVGVKE